MDGRGAAKRQGIAGRTLTGLVAALALLAVAAPTAEAERLKGKTSQGKTARLFLAGGTPTFVSFKWRADCNRGRAYIRTFTGFDDPFDRVGPNRIVDRGTSAYKQDKYRLRFRTAVDGRRKTDRLWKGTFTMHATVSRKGKVVNRCNLGTVNWYAKAR